MNVELREAGPDSVEAVLARNDVTAKELRAFVLSRTTSELASVWREIARHTAPEAEARPQLPAPARGPDTATSEEEPGDTAREKDPRLRPPPAVPDPVLPPAEIEPG